ncbi:transposase [Rahnella sp. AN3-3W3]|uniref:transposase n=1 Tax=Rahnella sp. AN3-3W3 TaxID=1610578 RepID=UPI000DD3B0EC
MSVTPIWRRNRVDISSFFSYPEDTFNALYTTNATESLNYRGLLINGEQVNWYRY